MFSFGNLADEVMWADGFLLDARNQLDLIKAVFSQKKKS